MSFSFSRRLVSLLAAAVESSRNSAYNALANSFSRWCSITCSNLYSARKPRILQGIALKIQENIHPISFYGSHDANAYVLPYFRLIVVGGFQLPIAIMGLSTCYSRLMIAD